MSFSAILSIFKNPLVIKITIAVVIFLFTGGSYYGGYKYIQHQKEVQRELESKISQLELKVEQNQQRVELVQSDAMKALSIANNNTKTIIELDTFTRESVNSIYRERDGKKSLEQLAEGKPMLVEKALSNGVKDVLRCFEVITGSEKGKDETHLRCIH